MDELDRLYRRVVHNLRCTVPERLASDFDVSFLHEQVVPYRTNRRELDFDSNEEYELALMQLLAGLRGYLQGDGELQRAMRTELSSPNPDLTAYRAFATATVRLAPEALRELARAPCGHAEGADSASRLSAKDQATLAGRATESVEVAGPSTRAEGVRSGPQREGALDLRGAMPPAQAPRPSIPLSPPPAPRASSPQNLAPRTLLATDARPSLHDAPSPPPEPPMAVPRSTPAAVSAGAHCRYCSSALPDGRRVTFCPTCGHNLTVQHCPACATELEVDWRFCITCGRGVSETESRLE